MIGEGDPGDFLTVEDGGSTNLSIPRGLGWRSLRVSSRIRRFHTVRGTLRHGPGLTRGVIKSECHSVDPKHPLI